MTGKQPLPVLVKRTETTEGSVEPSLPEAIGLLLLSFLILVVELERYGGFWGRIDQWLDNHCYVDAAAAIAIILVPKTVSAHFRLPSSSYR